MLYSLFSQVIGFSWNLKPFLSPLTVISLSISKPVEVRCILLIASFLSALNPVWLSVMRVPVRLAIVVFKRKLPTRLIRVVESAIVPRNRDPATMSVPLNRGVTRSGISLGRWVPSESIVTIISPCACWKPFLSAWPFPMFCG
jgi:hypothetical protein